MVDIEGAAIAVRRCAAASRHAAAGRIESLDMRDTFGRCADDLSRKYRLGRNAVGKSLLIVSRSEGLLL